MGDETEIVEIVVEEIDEVSLEVVAVEQLHDASFGSWAGDEDDGVALFVAAAT